MTAAGLPAKDWLSPCSGRPVSGTAAQGLRGRLLRGQRGLLTVSLPRPLAPRLRSAAPGSAASPSNSAWAPAAQT